MAEYQLLPSGGVLRAADGAAIPPDPRNTDWREYQDWLSRGGVADPAPAPAAAPKRLADVLEALPLARKKALLTNIGADPRLVD